MTPEIERETDAMSIDRFCARHGLSRSMFYKIVHAGVGPRLMKVGSRSLISAEAAAEWRHSSEKQAA